MPFFTRQDLPTPLVQTIDVGLSDHHLLVCWNGQSASIASLPLPLKPQLARDVILTSKLSARRSILVSPICHSDEWPDDVYEAAEYFDNIVTGMLDHIIPIRHFVRRPRPSDPWFDKECHDA